MASCLRPIILAVLLVGAAMPAHAQAPAGPNDWGTAGPDILREQLGQILPSEWRIVALTIDAQANIGTPGEPLIRSRLRATVALLMPTYLVLQTEGPFAFVSPVAQEGFRRTLYARASSIVRAGQWESRFEIETPEAIEIPGTPEATIPGRLILSGSDEERQLRAEWQAQAEARHAEAMAELRRTAAESAERAAAEAAVAEARRREEQAEAAAQAQREIERTEARLRMATAEAEAQRRQQEEGALAAARREVALQTARARAQDEAALQAAVEAERLAQARRAAAEATEAAARREADAQGVALRTMVERRAAVLAQLRASFASGDRNTRIAAMERAMLSDDLAARALGFEAALTSRDAAVLTMALRLFFQQTREVPVGFFAPAVQPRTGNVSINPSEAVLLMSSLVLSLRDFDLVSGSLAGVANLSGTSLPLRGTLGRSELSITISFPGGPNGRQDILQTRVVTCTLSLRLTEIMTFDGVFSCEPVAGSEYPPVLLARINLG